MKHLKRYERQKKHIILYGDMTKYKGESIMNQSQIRHTIRFKNLETFSYIKKQCELESQRRGENVSVNQFINELLEGYIAQQRTLSNPLLLSLEDKIDHQTLLIEELIDVIRNDFVPSIQQQTETYQQILETLLQ